MNHTLKLKLFLTVCAAVSLFSSCQLEPLDDDWKTELYTRNFIKEFGLVDPEQDWNMAERATININFGDKKPNLAKVYTKSGNTYYIVARLTGATGTVKVPVDIPEGTTDVLVWADGAEYYGDIHETINCSGVSSRNTVYGEESGNKTWEKNNYTVKVSWSTTGNLYDIAASAAGENGLQNQVKGVSKYIGYGNFKIDNSEYSIFQSFNDNVDPFEITSSSAYGTDHSSRYQYYNTQQIYPIVSNATDDGLPFEYFSLNTMSPNHYRSKRGILPENGVAGALIADEPDMTTNNITRDAFIKLGPSGKITIYPYYYNATYIHQFGVYLIDDNLNAVTDNGKSVREGGKVVKYPIFNDKQSGDIQIAPKLAKFTKFKVNIDGEWKTVSPGDGSLVFTIEKGKTYNLYDYIKPVDDQGNEYDLRNYSSKLGFHCWEDNVDEYISFNREGILKGLKISKRRVNNEDKDYIEGFRVSAEGKHIILKINIIAESPFRDDDVFALTLTDAEGYVVNNYAEVNIKKGESVTFGLSLTRTRDGATEDVWDDYADYLKCTASEWFGTYMSYSIDKNNKTITINGLEDNTAAQLELNEDSQYKQQWPKIYLDKSDNNWQGTSDDIVLFDFHVNVKDATKRVHSYSQTYNSTSGATWPLADYDKTWTSYFTERATGLIELWSGNLPMSWNTITIPASDLQDVVAGQTLVCEFDNYTSGHQLYTTYGNENGTQFQNNSWQPTSPMEKTIDETVASNLKTQGFTIKGDKLNLRSVYIQPPVSAGSSTEWVLKAADKSRAENNLKTYYTTNVPSYICSTTGHDDLGSAVDFSTGDVDVVVSISGNTSESYYDGNNSAFKYTVTWTKTETIEPSTGVAPRYKSARRSNHKRTAAPVRSSAKSRATEAEEIAALGIPATLVYDEDNPWIEPNKIWDRNRPIGDEAASYITDDPVLARSRGYTIEITDKSGNPYEGYIGFYIDVYNNPACEYASNYDTGYDKWTPDGGSTWNDSWYVSEQLGVTDGNKIGTGTAYRYTLYSQRELNIWENTDKTKYGDYEYDFSYAASFPHPSAESNRTFYTFEDWQVAHPAKGDIPVGQKTSPAILDNITYTKAENSSDRDFNDLIYALQLYNGAKVVNKDKEKERKDDDGYSWIWALEDLGSTDDFDFNDVIIKINSVTEINYNDTFDGEGEQTGSTQVGEPVHRVTVTPLAAGGTLPIYLHFVYKGGDYLLAPTGTLNPYNLANSSHIPTDDKAKEYHAWFGCSSTTMVNTGMTRVPINKVTMCCQLILPSAFSLTNAMVDANDAAMQSNGGGYFYVTVKQARVTNPNDTDEAIDADYQTTAEGWAIMGQKKGAATQSFLITCGKDNTDDMTLPWKWPTERTPIVTAYPNFKKWVSDKNSNTDWYMERNANTQTGGLLFNGNSLF